MGGAHLFSDVDLSGCPDRNVAFYCDTGLAAHMVAWRQAKMEGTSGTKYALGSYDNIKKADPKLIEIGEPSDLPNPCGPQRARESWLDWFTVHTPRRRWPPRPKPTHSRPCAT